MIKCPNCGSTVQVKIEQPKTIGKYCYREAYCACGEHFRLIYDLKKIARIEQGEKQ